MDIDKSVFNEFPTLESQRLVYRKVTSQDIEDIFNIYGDPEVARYDWFSPIDTKDRALDIINNYRTEFINKEEITWGVARKNDNRIIGYCNLGDFDQEALRCEIGYGFNRNQWNKGYGTEAIRTLTNFGFKSMRLNRIEAVVTLGNYGSIKALKKAGFTEEGTMRQRTFMKGHLVDDVMLSIIREDYYR